MRYFLLSIVLLPVLSGCGMSGDVATNLVKLPTGDIVSASTDRWGSWERVRSAEESTKSKALDAVIANKKAEQLRLRARENVTININSKDQLSIYLLGQANERLAQANENLASIAKALAGGGRSEYADLVSTTGMPEGAFAEGFKAFWAGPVEMARTPTAGIVAGGYAFSRVLDAMPKGSTTFNDTATLENSMNTNTLHQTGSTGDPYQGPYAVQPEIVTQPEPMVVQ